MRAQRLFVSAAAIALVAGPGLAMAQNGPPSETPPVETPPVTETPLEDAPPVETPPVEAPDDEGEDEELDLEVQQDDEVVTTDDEDATADDEGHGEAISALAECLPSGAELHGTGFNKGFIMRQAASGGEVMLGEGDEALPVANPEDAELLCATVQDLADQAEAPETAKGRPDWAGPKDKDGDSDVSTSSSDRRGPPAHANAGGKGKGAKGGGS